MEAAANDILSAAVPAQAPVVTAVVVRVRLELPNEISPVSVQPIIDELNNAQAGSNFELHLRHNGGGCVKTMIDLIVALNSTQADVIITFGRYVMSAAATIWLWFLVRETPNVRSLYPLKPGVVMYHRPRRMLGGEYICFANEVDPASPLKGPLLKQFQLFDDLFYEVHDSLLKHAPDGSVRVAPDETLICQNDGLTYRHWLARLKDTYLGNQDCLIPV
ncbi:hypothetical protein EUX58_02010 [Pseudomonas sp. 770NI]|uniref:hypothetical protein n=1 Tax=Pseudomonas sp. 770NI TaxID=2528664 RepID=UPI001023C4E2|nr:hypothetical protein [Pseudomonas sp. 770NI]RZI28238.1 hypothetical protein EUX58_02010 [Pseudomonas sp. 770NI]